MFDVVFGVVFIIVIIIIYKYSLHLSFSSLSLISFHSFSLMLIGFSGGIDLLGLGPATVFKFYHTFYFFSIVGFRTARKMLMGGRRAGDGSFAVS